MKLFYDEQLHRMECLGHELVPFDDIYCQMCDLVGLKPMAEDHALQTFDEFRIDDFLNGGPDHMQLCGNFFNMLFNLNKFVAFYLFAFRQRICWDGMSGRPASRHRTV